MGYMSRHGSKRTRPAELIAGNGELHQRSHGLLAAARRRCRRQRWRTRNVAYISRYALGRDYHKLLRSRLQKLCDRIEMRSRPLRSSSVHRQRAGAGKGLGAQCRPGLDRQAHQSDRSPMPARISFWARFTSICDLPADEPSTAHCGTCSACIPACPTGAIVGAVSARRAPLHFLSHHRARRRHSAGISPRDRQSHLRLRRLPAGLPLEQVCAPQRREGLRRAAWLGSCAARRAVLLERGATSWSGPAAAPFSRIGYERWLRNIAVALGNAPTSPAVIEALHARAQHPSALVREHVRWALAQHGSVSVDDPHP